MKRLITLTLAIAATVGASTSVAAPSLSDPTLSPTSWNSTGTASTGWTQNDFLPPISSSAEVQVNAAPDGSSTGEWLTRGSIGGPLTSGSNGIAALPVADLSGRHQVRVVISGAANSPLTLGTLQLDRSPPGASFVELTPEGGTVVASWSQSDELSGTDPASPITAEVNASPLGDAAGEWIPFTTQPPPGDGRRTATTHLGGLPDGRHLVRVRSRDRAGNAGAVVIGSVVSDRTPPRVADVSLAQPVTSPTALAELLYRGDDSAGVGLSGARARVAPVGSGDEVDWAVPGESGAGRVLVRLPGPGVYVVTVRLFDRVGNRGESAPVTIRVPTPAEAVDAAVGPPLGVDTRLGAAPSRRVAWVAGQVRRFHRDRGVRLTARIRVARDGAAWRRLLGTTAASRYTGYSTMRGAILLGPAANRGLEVVGALGLRTVRAGATSRADLDGAVLGLAVLLHESIHESGPRARSDVLGTRSGRTFEEGFAEDATLQLLRGAVARLDVPPDARARLLAAVGRYRPAYGAEVAWARSVSALATRSAPGSRRARAWRVRVADTWGADRWARLAVATRRDAASLRAQAAAIDSSGASR